MASEKDFIRNTVTVRCLDGGTLALSETPDFMAIELRASTPDESVLLRLTKMQWIALGGVAHKYNSNLRGVYLCTRRFVF